MKQSIQLSDHFTYGRLIRFTLPSIGMMVFASVYSVVDGFFVSNFAGKTPFAAINLIMPFLMILSTVGLMFGTGGSAIVAKTFGEGNREKGNQYFSLFVYVTAVLGIVFAILGIVFIRPIASLLGAEGAMLENAVIYARIILLALPFNVLQLLFQSFFVTAEKPKLGLIVTILSGFTNVILDAVLVISLPQAYKLAGAAIATALSQVVGGAVPLVYFGRKNSSILKLGKGFFDGFRLPCVCTFIHFHGLCHLQLGLFHRTQRRTYFRTHIIFENTCFPNVGGYSFADDLGNRRCLDFHSSCRSYGSYILGDILDYKTEKVSLLIFERILFYKAACLFPISRQFK